ncbi:unnamed protein product [Rhizophagus irregularis]|uniref:Uncharacterized protein n=1 Tax=Rhizophagus irregularis TaxID=588596 RepID=A0A915ZBQ0_9GLOM|nr:unnamed protein product [Rhizophagus irregularis]
MQFLGGDMLFALALQAHQAKQQPRRRIEQPHHRCRAPCQRQHRPRHRGRQRFRRAQRDLLGYQLANDQRSIGRDADDDHKADAFGGRRAQPQKMQPRRNRAAETRARIGTRQNPDQRDADLRRRQDLARVRRQRQRGARTTIAGARHRLQPRLARRDDRQFGHGENAVQNDQREDDRDVDPGKGGERCHGAAPPLRESRHFTTARGLSPCRYLAKADEISEVR